MNANDYVIAATHSNYLAAMYSFVRSTGGDISDCPRVSVDITAAMRRNHVTIKELAQSMQVTMKRVRFIRSQEVLRYIDAWDYLEAIEKLGAKRAGWRDRNLTIVSGETEMPAA